MLIAQIDSNNAVLKYPVSDYDLKMAFPNVSFPAVITPTCLPDGYVEVIAATAPSTNIFQLASEGTPVLQADGTWLQVWTSTDSALADSLNRALLMVDSLADSVRLQLVGSYSKYVEYLHTQGEAQDFKTAYYKGLVPPSVQFQADSTGVTYQQAADALLALGQVVNSNIMLIRVRRLTAEANLKACTNVTDLATQLSAGIASLNSLLTTS